eukprot:jgi/Mesvir1/18553/Mv17070-RA.1
MNRTANLCRLSRWKLARPPGSSTLQKTNTLRNETGASRQPHCTRWPESLNCVRRRSTTTSSIRRRRHFTARSTQSAHHSTPRQQRRGIAQVASVSKPLVTFHALAAMGTGSSTPLRSPRRRRSEPNEVLPLHSKSDSPKDMRKEFEASFRTNWLYPESSEMTTSSFERAIPECHREIASEVDELPGAPADQASMAGLAREVVRPDWASPAKLSGFLDDAKAAVAATMVGLLEMLEASVRAGRSTLSFHDLPHLVDCREAIAQCTDDIRHCASLLHSLGIHLQFSGIDSASDTPCPAAPEVELIHLTVLRIREASPGAELEVAETVLVLAQLCHSQGRFREAVSYFQRLARIVCSHLGHDHPSLAAALNFLAESQARAGRLSEAEFSCKRAWAIAAAALGVDHTHTQGYRRNLSAVRMMRVQQESQVRGMGDRRKMPASSTSTSQLAYTAGRPPVSPPKPQLLTSSSPPKPQLLTSSSPRMSALAPPQAGWNTSPTAASAARLSPSSSMPSPASLMTPGMSTRHELAQRRHSGTVAGPPCDAPNTADHEALRRLSHHRQSVPCEEIQPVAASAVSVQTWAPPPPPPLGRQRRVDVRVVTSSSSEEMGNRGTGWFGIQPPATPGNSPLASNDKRGPFSMRADPPRTPVPSSLGVAPSTGMRTSSSPAELTSCASSSSSPRSAPDSTQVDGAGTMPAVSLEVTLAATAAAAGPASPSTTADTAGTVLQAAYQALSGLKRRRRLSSSSSTRYHHHGHQRFSDMESIHETSEEDEGEEGSSSGGSSLGYSGPASPSSSMGSPLSSSTA